MPQDEFIRTILFLSDAYYQLKRSRTLLKAFWHEFDDFSFEDLSEEKTEQLNNLLFLLDTYDEISSRHLENMDEIIAESMTTIERMRREGFFNKAS